MNELLKLLEKDAQLTPDMLAAMLGKDTADIKDMIDKYEKDGTIAGYSALIDWEKTDREYVTALIELKVTPQREVNVIRRAARASSSSFMISGNSYRVHSSPPHILAHAPPLSQEHASTTATLPSRVMQAWDAALRRKSSRQSYCTTPASFVP